MSRVAFAIDVAGTRALERSVAQVGKCGGDPKRVRSENLTVTPSMWGPCSGATGATFVVLAGA